MALFHYQDQVAVSGLYCQDNFSNILFIPKREDQFELEGILKKHFCLGSKNNAIMQRTYCLTNFQNPYIFVFSDMKTIF